MQELFIPAAAAALPANPRINWNQYGIMTYFWPVVCERMEGLWVNVAEHEIMLATALSHTHVDEHEYEVRQLTDGDILDRIIRQGIITAQKILTGQIVFTKCYGPDGKESSSSGMSLRENWNNPDSRASIIKVFGKGWTEKAWDANGEVID